MLTRPLWDRSGCEGINKSWQSFNSLQRLFLEVQSMKVFNYLNNMKLFEMYLTYKHSTRSGYMLADV